MKKILLSFMFVMLSSITAWSAVGDTFTANTVEGVTVTYTVLSESPKTCKIGYTYVKNLGVRTAIVQSTSGAITIPSVVNGYKVKEVADYAFSGCKKVTSIVIPDDVTYLGKSAFNSCEKAERIELPNSISGDSFEDRTFAGCSSLTAINIPEGVTSIGTLAFNQCSSLTSVHIPSTVTAIYEQAFNGCTKISEIALLNGLMYIGSSAFNRCIIKSLSLPQSFTTSYGVNGISYSGTQIGTINSLNKVIVNDGVASLYEVFKNCLYIETVICYNEDPVNAYNCWKNAEGVLYVPKGSKEKYEADNNWGFNKIIEMDDNYDYSDVGDTFIENGLTYKITNPHPREVQVGLRSGAVDKNTAGSLLIPSSVKNTQTNKDYIVTSINDKAFQGCTNLNEVSIANGITNIGGNAFYGCYGLTGVSLPQTLASIGVSAFSSCTNLASVTIPNNVTSIGNNAFEGCNNLTSVTCESETPVSISENTFSNSSNATLYVPRGCIAEYEATDFWKDFKEIREITENITIGTAGMGTFCSTYPLDFSGTNDIKAYIVSAFKPSTGEVILTRITDVPANTGIVVKGDANTYTIPWGLGETIVSNMLAGVTENTVLNKVDGDYTNYILSNKNDKLGFYAVADGSTLSAGKAYLPLPTASLPNIAGARGVKFVFDDEQTTDIIIVGRINTDARYEVYDLQGRKVRKPVKGLYVVNGKKVTSK